jgi:DNA-binding Xre family transcriptional regulator
MAQVNVIPREIEFEDRYGEARVIHRRNGNRFSVKKTSTTPVLALNQELSMLVGQRIRALRIDRGMGLGELCDRAGLISATPKSRMWEIENSIRKQGVRLGTLYAIAMALGVEVAALMPSVDEVRGVASPQSEKRTAVRLTAR